jgi:hypothetical protein
VILLHHVRKMVMEKLEMIFAIASKLFACAPFVITLFNNLNIHVTLSLLTGLNQINLK